MLLLFPAPSSTGSIVSKFKLREDGYRSDKTAEQTQFFQVITIKGNTLSYVAYTALGDEYDRAIITKDFMTGKKFLKD